tara:strand:- start:232 stop:516 length:285 start_codon:yes stop_codon:yes gene_type:complete
VGQPAQRKGDANNIGAVIAGVTDNKVKVNGLLISINGSSVADHLPVNNVNTHVNISTANGSSTVKSGGVPVNRTTDADSCGHTRVGGSSNVNIG